MFLQHTACVWGTTEYTMVADETHTVLIVAVGVKKGAQVFIGGQEIIL
jgi:hypothetical protein